MLEQMQEAFWGFVPYSGQVLVLLLFLLALEAAVIDAKKGIIPNWICACVALVGITIQLLRLSTVFFPQVNAAIAQWSFLSYLVKHLPSAQSCLALAVLVLLCGFALEMLLRSQTGHSGMGMGDIKYIAAWTSVLGWYVFMALVAACLFGAIYALSTRRRTFAFGPWLSLSFVATLLLLFLSPSEIAILV